MFCKFFIGFRLAIINEDVEDSVEFFIDEEEEVVGEEERLVLFNFIFIDLFFFYLYRFLVFLMFYKIWKFNNLRYCIFKRKEEAEIFLR